MTRRPVSPAGRKAGPSPDRPAPGGASASAQAAARVALLALAALPAAPALPAAVVGRTTAAAQPATQGVVGGVVVAEGSQRPLGDVQIGVEGTTLGGTTDANGRFRITGVSGTEVRLSVRRIGFAPRTVTARVGATDLRIALGERTVELQQVVVTGTAGVAERRAIGNAVTTVKAADVVATQPVRSFQDLLTGRAAGVSVVGSSGQVGSGSRIRVRGASSLSLDNNPLIYVDGIRVDNAQASGPVNQAFGSASISRWNDFDPDDIESIEVIKGPAAATLYGTEASNGVIQIITKKGSSGRPQWNAVARVGANTLPDWRTRFFENYGVIPLAARTTPTDSLRTITVPQLNDSLQANFGNDIFRTGGLRDLQLGLSGGGPQLQYRIGAGYEENEGVERVNRLNRTNFRVNVAASPTRSVDVQTSVGYTTGRTYLPYESGGGGATWATFFSSPAFLYGGIASGTPRPSSAAGNSQLGFRSGPPDAYYQAYNLFQDADRFTGSLQLTNRPARWLDHRVIVGLDQLVEDNQTLAPRNDVIFGRYAAFSDVGGTVGGAMTVNTRAARNLTFDYVANAKVSLGAQWQSVTSAGGQYYARRTRLRTASGNGFPAAGLTSLGSAAVVSTPTDDLFDNNTLGGFVQQQFIWNDRLFITGAVRRDDNSAFGTDYPAVTYPKLQASYVLSEEKRLSIPAFVNTLRLRAAYGGAGLQPGAFDAIRTYAAAAGTLTPSNAGNLALGPERSFETELGVDGGLWDDRLSFELTYFDGATRDAILSRQAPPSGGFPGLQLFNAGRVDRSGFEWLVRAEPLRTRNVSLDLTLNGSTNEYVIRDMGGNQFVSLSAQVQHAVGYAPGAWWDRRVVSATRDANGTVPRASMQCDDGRGGTTPCYNAAGALVAPRVFLGNSVPTREGSIGAGLTLFRNVRVNSFFDYRGGYAKLDGNRRVRCNLFFLCRENYFPNEFDAVTLAEAQNGTAFTYNLIQDASFVRFRELSLSWTTPARFARALRASSATITVAGRNLGLWTEYGGVEPEASFNGGTRGGAFGQWEQNVLPQLRTFVTTINLNF